MVYPISPLMTFDLHEGHHVKLASVVLMTKFRSYRALFNIFAPSGPRGPACATPKIHHAHL